MHAARCSWGLYGALETAKMRDIRVMMCARDYAVRGGLSTLRCLVRDLPGAGCGAGRSFESRAGAGGPGDANGPQAEAATCVRATGPFPRPAGLFARVVVFVRSWRRAYQGH